MNRENGLRPAAAGCAVVCALVVAALGLAVAGGRAPWPVDSWAAGEAAALTAWYGLLLAVDQAGEPVGAATLVGLLAVACVVSGRPRLALVALGALALTGLAVVAIKAVVGRSIHDPGNLAFPSGHTATATVLSLVLMLLVVDLARPGRRAGALLVAGGTLVASAVMAVVQVALDAHYLTDTIGGLCLAVVVVTLTARLADALPLPGDRAAGQAAAPDPRSDPP